ncbi:hypothetical protein BX600DRAFT_498936 [Xylariales sp. PMI_506]|nr:hypothetical protein BX600DRAFT_498936 [Xylariales sp. PMI_506]
MPSLWSTHRYAVVQSDSPTEKDIQQNNGNSYQWWRILTLVISGIALVSSSLLFASTYYMIHSHTTTTRRETAGYWDLQTHNITRLFYERVDLVNETATPFWRQILKDDGIIAVDTQWAKSHDFPNSATHPYDESLSVYQVDVFHAIHCLDRLRSKLIAGVAVDLPYGDYHTAHCIDYLRQYLMCHSDISLKASPDSLYFTENPEHQCRDFDAIHKWVNAHAWSGFRDWFAENKKDER